MNDDDLYTLGPHNLDLEELGEGFELPVIRAPRDEAKPVSCTDCGKCCQWIGFPPSYEAGLWDPVPPWFPPSEDGQRFYVMPDEAREAIRERYTLLGGSRTDENSPRFRSRPGMACCWLDPDTKACRWYEYRPDACRDFIKEGDDCYRCRDEGLRLVNASPNEYYRQDTGFSKGRGADCFP